MFSVLAIAGMVACDESADDNDAVAEATVCATVGTSWSNQGFTQQTGRFEIEFTVTPARANIDAVVGLSSGAASQWASLAAAVRFNLQGTIDARAGSAYRAENTIAYQAGTTYAVRMQVDMFANTYWAWVNGQTVARGYAFRTEQTNVTKLDNAGAYVNPSYGGSMTVCGYTIRTLVSHCTTHAAGQPFGNAPTQATTTVLPVMVSARPSHANMDGVIGFSNGPADAFNDFAAALRFGVSGNIEVRDADTYRADVVVPYVANREYRFKLVIDIASKTYSVFVLDYPNFTDVTQIARGYRFRTQQAGITRIDNLGAIVDSATGSMDVCNIVSTPLPTLLAARDGTHDVHPFADGSALISDATRTIVVDANNAVRAAIPEPGRVAGLTPGMLYTARLLPNGGGLRATAYQYDLTGNYSPRYIRHHAWSATSVLDTAITYSGLQAIALGSTSPNIIVLDEAGSFAAVIGLPSNLAAISLGGANFAIAVPIANGYEVQVRRYDGSIIVSRQIAGNFTIEQLSIAGDNTVVFGGHLGAETDFGNCAIAPFSHEDGTWDAYVTALDTELATRFCDRLTTEVTDIEHDASRIAVAFFTQTQLPHVETFIYDTAGNVVASNGETGYVGHFGNPGTIALGANKHYLNVFVSFGGPVEQRLPFLVTVAH